MRLDEYEISGRKNNKVLQTLKLGKLNVLVLDIRGLNPFGKKFRNVVAVDQLGYIVWVAELPSKSAPSSYQYIKVEMMNC